MITRVDQNQHALVSTFKASRKLLIEIVSFSFKVYWVNNTTLLEIQLCNYSVLTMDYEI